ncbi:hypothetical protein TRICI_003807 [Trichomonascus ciferrii]|uniref:Uncharacterized protein n=1 Tax=Trichomonascus ciferrii TaxID=44093 RepID=A0A642V423_9ASCO|nr:hypothetical protein TRICI_003807 [Trichomonascus ciferrii]
MSDKKEQEFKHTVMPKDDSLEKQKDNHGAPGIQIPQNANDIKEFSEVRNVDAKKFNEEIHKAEEAAKKSSGSN